MNVDKLIETLNASTGDIYTVSLREVSAAVSASVREKNQFKELADAFIGWYERSGIDKKLGLENLACTAALADIGAPEGREGTFARYGTTANVFRYATGPAMAAFCQYACMSQEQVADYLVQRKKSRMN